MSSAAAIAEISQSIQVVQGACPHDCPDTCALRITVEDGRVTRVAGDHDHPPTHGALCTKVSRYAERTYHPERVLTPLKRVGEKGEGRFEPVGWNEALTDIAARLQAIVARDPEAILPYSYAGTMGLVQGDGMAARFFHKLGASLLDRTICASAGAEGLMATYGGKVGMHVEFFAESKLILIWGSNPITSSVHFWNFAQQAKRAGAKLICIDPRRTESAEKCHQHIALRPGTDGALALGLMHELITHDLLDHDYVNRFVEGWQALRERALQWPPERTAEVCGITADEVRGLAQDYGRTKPAAIRLNYGMQRVRGGGNAVRLVALLPCLTGAWRHRAGGLLLSSSGWFKGVRHDAWLQRPDLLGAKTPRTINMSTIGDELLREASPAFGPKIEAVVVYNSNPVAVAPESGKVVQGFAREDLFTVVLEHFLTDTADHADYVLPATTQLEHWDAHSAYGHTYALINRPAIAPLGQARSNAEIFRALAVRMGFDEPCFQDSDEAMARGAFDAQRVNLDELFARGWSKLQIADAPFAEGGFPTPSGKAWADAPGYGLPDHVPNYECAEASPELAARYPLAMISPPARHFLNSTFVNVASLRAAEKEPLLEMHADDAGARGIQHGAEVLVFNDRGHYRCKVAVSSRARPGVVNGLGIWWRKMGLAGTNVNELTHQRLTDLGRAPSFYDCLVEVRAASSRRRAFWLMALGGLLGTGVLAAATLCLTTGCSSLASSLGYYAQAAGGHLDLMQRARPVADAVADPATPEPLRQRLQLSQRLRDFAVAELKLPDNSSYRRYADLQRDAVVWNVVAAPELGLTLKTWCFPVMGCVGYRGYFDRAQADALAAQLKAEGWEVMVYGVPAYSTLGFSNWVGGDPLLNTFIRWSEAELARLLFHELAHQVVYVDDDTTFNESFATAVERAGTRRWLAAHGTAQALAEVQALEQRREDFRALTQRYRERLRAAYAGEGDEASRRTRKAALMAELRADYVQLKTTRWAGFAGYDGWFERANNASFGVLAAYNELVPGFESLLQAEGGDYTRFYGAVRALAALPAAERRKRLNAVSPNTTSSQTPQ